MKHFLPAKARHPGGRKEQLRFWLLGLATVYEGLIIAVSLGYLTVDTRAWLLFDVFTED